MVVFLYVLIHSNFLTKNKDELHYFNLYFIFVLKSETLKALQSNAFKVSFVLILSAKLCKLLSQL
ncbi:MAG: hypothetical protein DCF19_08345 [Pseudanabaena frigida]|uniref:Uncharacterized protein n=1 Tax=Pseudanabaena frigida TaxID=945775 RepID=A0A2W4Y325_9CYAN|nr:MAG: hypothetical protein DCF19_08345 [Pseudanabaena frigida]